ncbi:LacI family DNA-binding transcriptional regulator [Herbaspirillum autotrophicum]|uniref:LacI family DNA-binding transcriptional regulator n=1 Tax=Herbaspirillum autotrophicum TaxID=180195 RepID=UPI0009FA2E71|nr:LacI family DNA-binding transcriptional regulator [Herbaspirillum autotrophicum]
MKKAFTQKDVAKFAGVSQAAVSRFVSGKGSLSEEVRNRILTAINLVDYKPDPIARNLSNRQSDIVAIVMANITNPWYPVVLELITRRLQTLGLQVLLFNATPPQTVDDLMPLVLRYRVRGVIITTASLSSKSAELCVHWGVPVVMFNRYATLGAGYSVSCDNIAAGRKVADEFHRIGAQEMAYIGGIPEVSNNRDRKRGFTERIAELRIRPPMISEKEYTYDWGYAATLALFKKNPAITAVFCADDEIATGAIDALRFALKKKVPEDVVLIGFDDHPIASRAAYQLTTVRQPVEEMIEQALDMLLNGNGEPELRLLEGEFIYRSSMPAPAA